MRNLMKSNTFYCSHSIVIISACFLLGCSKEPENKQVKEVVRPAQIKLINNLSQDAKLRFPGRVRAVKRAELSFDVPGLINEFSVLEGRKVQKGEIVARLEDSLFRSKVNAAMAEFEHAKIDYERYQRLWSKESAVAQSEVDERKTRLEVARTQLSAVQQELEDSIIRAPFSGVLTRRHVENYSNVQAKQPIADLQDISQLEVVINVPERLVRTTVPQKKAQAIFDGQENQPVLLELKSYSAQADAQTQTFEIILKLTAIPKNMILLPGMSLTVMPFGSDNTNKASGVMIPLTAVSVDANGNHIVWVVNREDRVEPRNVVLGEVTAGLIHVISGLEQGQRIITAGVGDLRANIKVRPMESQ